MSIWLFHIVQSHRMTNIDVSNLKNPNQPREIRTRTGQLEDPLPEGKKIEEKEFPNITPAKHDSSDQPELSKEELEAHKEGLKQMQKKDPKHGGEPNSLSKKDHIGSSVEMHGRESRA